jgi:hypothetical protein
MTLARQTHFLLVVFTLVALPMRAGWAQQGPTAAEMAEKLANPTTALASLTSNFDFTEYTGDLPQAGNQRGWKYIFQPVFPFPQKNGANLLFRPAVPILFKQPVFGNGEFSDETELGDIGFDLVYGGTHRKTGILFTAGVAGSLPTATSDDVGSDQWQLGPELLVGIARPWGVVGVLVNHQWDIFGNDDRDVDLTSGQYFYAFPIFDRSWQIAAGPSWSYNHELDGEKWTLPVGTGLAKTTMIGNRVWKFSVQYWYYVKQPDAFGAQHTIRFTVTPVVDVPW